MSTILVRTTEALELLPESAIVPNLIKKKKGRPKKTPLDIVTVEDVVPEKKKRGRKKKEKVEEEVKQKQKKKRGRKAALKYYSSTIRKQMPLNTVIYDNDNALLHLDIRENLDTNNKKITYDVLKNEYNHHSTILEAIDYGRRFDSSEDGDTGDIDCVDCNDDVLCEYIDNMSLENEDITALYEKRLESRLVEDKQLITNLDNLHHDDVLLSKLIKDVDRRTSVKQEKNIVQNEGNLEDKQRGFFRILSEYIDTGNWIEKTNVSCWWCCHTFDTIPIGFPIGYSNHKFRVTGIYCSFSCMIADKQRGDTTSKSLVNALYTRLTGGVGSDRKQEYTEMLTKDCEHKHLFDKEQDMELQRDYISSMLSVVDSPLKPAPPRCTLKMFGGQLTIEEFRSATKERRVYKMINYPMYVSRDYVEAVDLNILKKVNKNVFNSKNNILAPNKLGEKQLDEVKSRINSNVVVSNNCMDRFIKF